MTAVPRKAIIAFSRPPGDPGYEERVASAKLFSRDCGGALSATLYREIVMDGDAAFKSREPWNKGKLVGQKTPFRLKEIWAIRVRLQMAERAREPALFNLGIDSKLRACDLTALRVRDICHGGQVASRAMVLQRKTQRPVQFEITAPAREAVQAWIHQAGLQSADFLFPSRREPHGHIGTRQYARVLRNWVKDLGLDPSGYGTHSMRRTKASLIYKRTKNLRAVQLLLGHSKIDYLPRRTMSRRGASQDGMRARRRT